MSCSWEDLVFDSLDAAISKKTCTKCKATVRLLEKPYWLKRKKVGEVVKLVFLETNDANILMHTTFSITGNVA